MFLRSRSETSNLMSFSPYTSGNQTSLGHINLTAKINSINVSSANQNGQFKNSTFVASQLQQIAAAKESVEQKVNVTQVAAALTSRFIDTGLVDPVAATKLVLSLDSQGALSISDIVKTQQLIKATAQSKGKLSASDVTNIGLAIQTKAAEIIAEQKEDEILDAQEAAAAKAAAARTTQAKKAPVAKISPIKKLHVEKVESSAEYLV